MKYVHYKLTYALPFVAAFGLFLILSLTNPLSIGPGGILAVFFLVYVLCASVCFIVLHAGIGFVTRFLNRRTSFNIREWSISVRKAYYVASVIAFGPVLLLAMQSVGQLQLRDVILMISFVGIAVFYVIKRT